MNQISIKVGSRYRVDRKKIRSSVEKVLSEHARVECVVSVSIVGERRMRELHTQYMQDPTITDVLSFPQYDPTQLDKNFPLLVVNDPITVLGDIVVCFPEAVREARKLGKMVDDQICFLVEHGMLHLLGFHHD
ncbi:MAG: putative rRNA maturation factor [Microgenomates group bacterium GW2011_GWF2_45_18]|nr:MAG: putative rRNA maturation factor [Microgenomates group bacterium GW2011_GWF1_44_10]KKU01421.1 MAG: putative rRNA maturation factor [Microgenomates group bacterium GW2011_GWF2_45_18]OGJ41499.1 MAG: rRNA maturation RNase YbeY [Candidatus Pacebacteria bacterium RIFOXYB1_FULL_44_10]HAU98863.1 rRNA maturation RNase YbeY [Candidatus Paceibacterota bacterium]HAX01179.1 rRNA maturation RNase YbeY [Candidatus Paceibacterota bacterium]